MKMTINPAAVRPHPSDAWRRELFVTFCHDTTGPRRIASARRRTGGISAVGSRSGDGGTGTEARPYSGFGSVGSLHGSAGGYM